jgi:transcription initiation factor TFIIE subunit alpha
MSKKTDDIDSFLIDDVIRKELINSAGENAIDILKLLKKETEDEKIAEMLKLKVSDVRSVLNKLNAIGITFYNRTKNEDTGWFYYNWSIDRTKFREWIITTVKNQDARIRYAHLIKDEHYYCPGCGLETHFSFDDAMNLSFKCPSCQNSMELVDIGVIDRHFGRPRNALRHAPNPMTKHPLEKDKHRPSREIPKMAKASKSRPKHSKTKIRKSKLGKKSNKKKK